MPSRAAFTVLPVAMPSSTTTTVRPVDWYRCVTAVIERTPTLDLGNLAAGLILDIAGGRAHGGHRRIVQHHLRVGPVDHRADAELRVMRSADFAHDDEVEWAARACATS
jgi:hypothetical protein